MELIKALSNLKTKSYYMAFMLLFTLTVPGILILFHFFRDIFLTYDTLHLLMLIGTIGVGMYIVSYLLSASVLAILFFIHKDNDIEGDEIDENDFLEMVFVMSSQLTLLFMFLLSSIYYFKGDFNFLSFVIWFVGLELLYAILTGIGLNSMLKDVIKEEHKKKEEHEKAEADRLLKVELLSKEINSIKKQKQQIINKLKEVKRFKFMRTNNQKQNEIQAIEHEKTELDKELEEKENELEQLIK